MISPTDATRQAERQRHRARYESQLAASGRAVAPEPTDRRRSLPAEAIRHHERIPGGWYWTTLLVQGEALRIVNTEGTSTVSMIAWSHADATERVNTADTMKVQWSTELRKGRLLLTDMGRVACSLIEDTCAAHEALAGPTTRACAGTTPDGAPRHNSRDNFLLAAAKLGLSRRDVPPCVNFFAPVVADARGRLVWQGERRHPGDFVDLRAEMDLWVVLSNAGHPLEPRPAAAVDPVDAIRFVAPDIRPDDCCRNAGAEAERAFSRTRLFTGSTLG